MQYHRELLAGSHNIPLLKKMISDVAPMMAYVIENSELRHHPDRANPCPKCQELMGFHDEGNGDPQVLARPGFDMGYWQCESCGYEEGWEQVLSKRVDDRGKWMYTDAFETIAGWLMAMQSGDIEKMHGALEAVVQFAHGSGPQANWFIEGGEATVNKVRQMAGWVGKNCKFAQENPPATPTDTQKQRPRPDHEWCSLKKEGTAKYDAVGGWGYAVVIELGGRFSGGRKITYTAGDAIGESQAYRTGQVPYEKLLEYARDTAKDLMDNNCVSGQIMHDPKLLDHIRNLMSRGATVLLDELEGKGWDRRPGISDRAQGLFSNLPGEPRAEY